MEFATGEQVEAYWPESNEWLPAWIKEVRSDSYGVTWEDWWTSDLPSSYVRRAICSGQEQVEEAVEAVEVEVEEKVKFEKMDDPMTSWTSEARGREEDLTRTCSICKRDLARSAYSMTQWVRTVRITCSDCLQELGGAAHGGVQAKHIRNPERRAGLEVRNSPISISKGGSKGGHKGHQEKHTEFESGHLVGVQGAKRQRKESYGESFQCPVCGELFKTVDVKWTDFLNHIAEMHPGASKPKRQACLVDVSHDGAVMPYGGRK
eukprot:TRINITY_DN60753_c0_g1_i1.p1 TRINITY_DN60753_c0_g1~~TRINITY_DN60753_c0_g1_i1.p1  ORF type:complete len:263 (+),score=40.53 TRINITY_DN60753_c0_g1_i1:39-827(+)